MKRVPRYIQAKNPITGKYVKLDRGKGKIVSHKKSEGPYKNINIIGEDNEMEEKDKP